MSTKCQWSAKMSKIQIVLQHFGQQRHKACLSNPCQMENYGQNHLQEGKNLFDCKPTSKNYFRSLVGCLPKKCICKSRIFNYQFHNWKKCKAMFDTKDCITFALHLWACLHLPSSPPLSPLNPVFASFFIFCKTEAHKIKLGWPAAPPPLTQQWQQNLGTLSNNQWCPKIVPLLRHQAVTNCYVEAVWGGVVWWWQFITHLRSQWQQSICLSIQVQHLHHHVGPSL